MFSKFSLLLLICLFTVPSFDEKNGLVLYTFTSEMVVDNGLFIVVDATACNLCFNPIGEICEGIDTTSNTQIYFYYNIDLISKESIPLIKNDLKRKTGIESFKLLLCNSDDYTTFLNRNNIALKSNASPYIITVNSDSISLFDHEYLFENNLNPNQIKKEILQKIQPK